MWKPPRFPENVRTCQCLYFSLMFWVYISFFWGTLSASIRIANTLFLLFLLLLLRVVVFFFFPKEKVIYSVSTLQGITSLLLGARLRLSSTWHLMKHFASSHFTWQSGCVDSWNVNVADREKWVRLSCQGCLFLMETSWVMEMHPWAGEADSKIPMSWSQLRFPSTS